ncbi:hypothetical protein PMIN07_004032 [Paraphaeosphaeria minitans]
MCFRQSLECPTVPRVVDVGWGAIFTVNEHVKTVKASEGPASYGARNRRDLRQTHNSDFSRFQQGVLKHQSSRLAQPQRRPALQPPPAAQSRSPEAVSICTS